MKPIWIIQNFADNQSHHDLVNEVVKQRFDYIVINGNPPRVDTIPKGSCVVFYGSKKMLDIIKGLFHDCAPIAWVNKDAYNCNNYYSYYYPHIFNRKADVVKFKTLQDNKFDFYKKYGKEAVIFIRPNTGEKLFSGQLVDLQDFDKFCEKNKDLSPNELLLVSRPKKIIGEWRFVVKNGKILAQSTYQYQGQYTIIPAAPRGATELCNLILKGKYKPDPIYTIDICEDTTGTYFLLEFNSFNCAGLYACNKEPIVREVSALAEEDWTKKYDSNKIT